ncbi:hypothetical protein ABPG73_006494 [Tetrahymena malaccensis]
MDQQGKIYLSLKEFAQLDSSHQTLVDLQIDLNIQSLEDIDQFFANLRKCEKIKSLDLIFTSITYDQLIALISEISTLKFLRSLKLNFENYKQSQIKEDIKLGSLFRKLTNLNILKFQLYILIFFQLFQNFNNKRYCQINDEKVIEIANGLSHLTNLTYLYICLWQILFQIDIQPFSFRITSKYILSHFQHKLKLSYQLILSLEIINLSFQTQRQKNIGYEGAITLGNVLCSLKNLINLRLYLGRNQVQDKGAVSICKGISELKNLVNLKFFLWSNSIHNEGAFMLGKALKNLYGLKVLKLNLQDNLIEDEGGNAILDGLTACQNLNSLKLSLNQNKTSTKFNFNVSKCICGLKNLSSLKLRYAEDCNYFKFGLVNCSQIKILKIELEQKLYFFISS